MKKFAPVIFGLAGIVAFAGCSRTSSIFDGKTLNGWVQAPSNSWNVADGAMASTGAGPGVIYTEKDYGHYRLTFQVRHVSGNPDHPPGVIIFGTRPADDAPSLEALGGVQLQPPNGGHWDYRIGQSRANLGEFIVLPHRAFDSRQWCQVEILVDASQGTARMAVAQPPGNKAVEVLDFKNPAAGKIGPIAWQMHNAGLHDEYKDVKVEVNPKVDDLLTTK